MPSHTANGGENGGWLNSRIRCFTPLPANKPSSPAPARHIASEMSRCRLVIGVGGRSHLLHMLLVEYFLRGQQLDDSTGTLVECRALLLGVAGVAEGDEE